MKKTLLILALIGPLYGQQTNRFFAVLTGSVSAAGTLILTIQQPTSGSNTIFLESANASCDAQTFTLAQRQNGVAASTTALTQTTGGTLAVGVSGFAASPGTTLNKLAAAQIFTASNAGIGTATFMTLPYAAGAIAQLSFMPPSNPIQVVLGPGNSTYQPNYTLVLTNTGGSSCTGTIQLNWREQ